MKGTHISTVRMTGAEASQTGRASALSGSTRGAPSTARRGMAAAVPPDASAARSAHGAKASGIEARQGRDDFGDSLPRTKARPARATPSKPIASINPSPASVSRYEEPARFQRSTAAAQPLQSLRRGCPRGGAQRTRATRPSGRSSSYVSGIPDVLPISPRGRVIR